MLILDTHVLLHSLTGDLLPKEEKALQGEKWSIAGITLWEIALLKRGGRIEFDWHDPIWTSALKRIHVWPISPEICAAMERLDFRGDPADELIAATSLVHKLPFATRDARIRKSNVLKFAL